jgi:hypothetical protein
MLTNLIVDQIIRGNPDLITDKYKVIALKNATGVCYVTNGSPQFISGHLRLKGRNNGSYPYQFKELIVELFGECAANETELEVCSGTVQGTANLITVDINPDKGAKYTFDAQELPDSWTNKFARWHCDPPYSVKAAQEMYGLTDLLSMSRLLIEGARVTKPGGLLFLLLGAKNMQWCPDSRIGWIGITIVPNQEIRALHIYIKKLAAPLFRS